MGKRLLKFVSLSSLMMFVLGACVNEEYGHVYDKVLDGDLDMNVNVLKNVSVPLGSFDKVLLKDVLELTEDISMIEIGENGDISLCVRNLEQELTQTFSVPNFNFADAYEGVAVSEPLGTFNFIYDPGYGSLKEELLKPRQLPDIQMVVEFANKDLPSFVKDLGYVELGATASVSLSAQYDRELPVCAYLAEGTKVTFPEWIDLGQMDDRFVTDGNTLTLVKPISLNVSSSSDPYETVITVPVIGIDARKLSPGQGIQEDGTFYIKDMVTISGKTYFDVTATSPVSLGLVSPSLCAYADFSELQIKTVEVLLKDLGNEMLEDMEPLYLDKLPDFMYTAGIVLDVNELRLDMEFSNTTPFSGKLSAEVSSWTGNECLAEIGISGLEFKAGSISEPKVMKWSFVDSPNLPQLPEGYELIEVDGLADVVKTVPERIEFDDFEFDVTDEFVKVVPGDEYIMSESFTLYSPLAFGEEFNLPYKYEISDLGLAFTEADFKSAKLELDVESSLPMDFNADLTALDDEGKIIEGLELAIKDAQILKAGSLDAPVTTHLVFEFSNTTGTIDIDGFEINFMASAPDSPYVGIPLNINQGLHFKNMVLTLPEGVFVNMNEL